MKIGTKAWIVTRDGDVYYATFKLVDAGWFSAYYWVVDMPNVKLNILHKYVRYAFRIKERKVLSYFTESKYSYDENGESDYTWKLMNNWL